MPIAICLCVRLNITYIIILQLALYITRTFSYDGTIQLYKIIMFSNQEAIDTDPAIILC